jgi:hypothetical protein
MGAQNTKTITDLANSQGAAKAVVDVELAKKRGMDAERAAMAGSAPRAERRLEMLDAQRAAKKEIKAANRMKDSALELTDSRGAHIKSAGRLLAAGEIGVNVISGDEDGALAALKQHAYDEATDKIATAACRGLGPAYLPCQTAWSISQPVGSLMRRIPLSFSEDYRVEDWVTDRWFGLFNPNDDELFAEGERRGREAAAARLRESFKERRDTRRGQSTYEYGLADSLSTNTTADGISFGDALSVMTGVVAGASAMQRTQPASQAPRPSTSSPPSTTSPQRQSTFNSNNADPGIRIHPSFLRTCGNRPAGVCQNPPCTCAAH